jgi:small subunit ribosomal protein S13
LPKDEEEEKTDKGKDAKEGKGKKGKKEEKKSEPTVRAPREPVKEDFKYIVRIADTDLDGYQSVELALCKIKGIGRRTAIILADRTGLPRGDMIGNLNDDQVNSISKALTEIASYIPTWMVNRQGDYDTGEDLHIYSTELVTYFRDDINRMKKIKCYRGVRHEKGKKVRGQRTRSNGRKGLTLGVIRTKLQPGAPAADDKARRRSEVEEGNTWETRSSAERSTAARPIHGMAPGSQKRKRSSKSTA